MVTTYKLPYGNGLIQFTLPGRFDAHWIAPREVAAAKQSPVLVADALSAPLGDVRLESHADAQRVAIAINDKARPVPNEIVLPPLLEKLARLGIGRDRVHLLIASGAHPPMRADEFKHVLPGNIAQGCRVSSHDCDDQKALVYLGETSRGTPVWVHRVFWQADLRIVVGNIEPHQFQGFSGGVKSAAIGLAGRETININHALMMDPNSRLGEYEKNPARQDVEEIGKMMGVHFALNTVLNRNKKLVRAYSGDPIAVMQAGIPLARQIYAVQVTDRFDLVVASPGGYPKDLNLYQAQKALAHAALVTRPGGRVILVAACPEGAGSEEYTSWVSQCKSLHDVRQRFKTDGFCLGPHKAYQFARDLATVKMTLVSEMDPQDVRRFLLEPAGTLEHALVLAIKDLPDGARIGIMPMANATIPLMLH